MPGKVIGIKMNTGYVGTVSASADAIIQGRIAKKLIKFGEPVVLVAAENKYLGVADSITDGTDFTATQFAGIAVREVVQANVYDPQETPGYAANSVVDVLTRGQCTVLCQRGTPTAGGTVYVRTATSDTYPTAVVGGFEASEEAGKTVALTNVQWTTGNMNADKVAEVTVLTRNKA